MSEIVAFDADVLIYAGVVDHDLGTRVLDLLLDDQTVAVGSALLLPEVLTKPMRTDPDSDEVNALFDVLSRIRLHPLSGEAARLAVILATTYRLRAADASHLATAVTLGATAFVTNNRKDFPRHITEVDIVYPSDLPR